MRPRHFAVLTLAFGLSTLAHAVPVSYTFTTFGGDLEYGGSLSQGNGSLTVDAVPGSASTLTAFTYSLTATASGLPTVQTTFGPGDVTLFESTVTGTDSAPLIQEFSLDGTAANSAFFNLGFISQFSTSGQPLPLFAYYSASAGYPEVGSEGTVEYTPVTDAGTAVTPEPSSFALLGTGLLGLAGVVRRRLV